jgi:hypothetical protein
MHVTRLAKFGGHHAWKKKKRHKKKNPLAEPVK